MKNESTDLPSNSEHWNGQAYRRVSFPQLSINTAFLNEHTFHGGEKVLDIGCGDGQTSREIASRIPRSDILGIDASESMIETAIRSNQHPQLRFQLMNAQQLNFTAEFDVSTCFFCMQWIPDKQDTFKRIYKCLNKNGRFLMIVPLPHPHLPQLRNELITSLTWKKYFQGYVDPLIYINDSNYESYTSNAGFRTFDYRVDQTPVRFDNYNSFFEFMSQMTPHLSRLPTQAEKTAFLHELLEQYLKIYPISSDGTCHLNFDLVKLCAII